MDKVRARKGPTKAVERKELTPELKAESDRLKALWKARPVGKGGKKIAEMDFGLKHDLGSQGNVGHYLNGRQPLNLKAAIAFAKELGCPIAHFSPRLAALQRAPELADPVLDIVEGIGKLPLEDQQQLLDFISYRFERADEKLFGDGKSLQHYLQMIATLKQPLPRK
jgi:hypothetical protein